VFRMHFGGFGRNPGQPSIRAESSYNDAVVSGGKGASSRKDKSS
jgi:hypothetical protein